MRVPKSMFNLMLRPGIDRTLTSFKAPTAREALDPPAALRCCIAMSRGG
jgi:hypothetical protein